MFIFSELYGNGKLRDVLWAVFLPIIALAVAILLVWLASPLVMFFYQDWALVFQSREFEGSLPYIYVGLVGILVTLLVISLSLFAARQNQRKQDTIKILFESRMSAHYMTLLDISERHFPPGKRAAKKIYFNPKGKAQKASASATEQILNYFEFLSVGMRQGNLDADMLKKSKRGILCRLVYDMQDIIAAEREKKSKKVFEALVAIYFEWVDESAINTEWDENITRKLKG